MNKNDSQWEEKFSNSLILDNKKSVGDLRDIFNGPAEIKEIKEILSLRNY